MRQWARLGVFAAFVLALAAGAAQAADAGKLKNLQAPPPAAAPTLPPDARTVRFARLLAQLKPEP
jgi:hypothetical protein